MGAEHSHQRQDYRSNKRDREGDIEEALELLSNNDFNNLSNSHFPGVKVEGSEEGVTLSKRWECQPAIGCWVRMVSASLDTLQTKRSVWAGAIKLREGTAAPLHSVRIAYAGRVDFRSLSGASRAHFRRS